MKRVLFTSAKHATICSGIHQINKIYLVQVISSVKYFCTHKVAILTQLATIDHFDCRSISSSFLLHRFTDHILLCLLSGLVKNTNIHNILNFRSLGNLIAHKRSFCSSKYKEVKKLWQKSHTNGK